MDLYEDNDVINGDFNLINELNNDYNESSDNLHREKRIPEACELLFSIAYGALNHQINKENRVDYKEKKGPWVFKKDRREYLLRVEEDHLKEEIEDSEVNMLRELEYQKYVSEVEYPDTSSVDPTDYIKCLELNGNSYTSVLSANTFNISNMFMEFESTEIIDVNEFIDILQRFNLKYVQFADRTLMNSKANFNQYESENTTTHNFIPDIISGLLEGYDLNPDLNKYVIKFSNTKFLQFRDNLQFCWDLNDTIFEKFRVRLFIYGKYINKELYKKLYPKDYTNICLKSGLTNIYNYKSENSWKMDTKLMNNYDQIFGFIFDPKIDGEHMLNEPKSILEISMVPNGFSKIKFSYEDWVIINFGSIKIYLVMLDPMLKDIKTFKSYLKGNIDYDHVSGINLSRIDNIRLYIKINTNEPTHLKFFNIGIGYAN